MNFNIDITKITTRELIQAEQSTEATVELMARFMVDDNDKAIPVDDAREQLLDLSLDKLAEFSDAFLSAFRRTQTRRRH